MTPPSQSERDCRHPEARLASTAEGARWRCPLCGQTWEPDEPLVQVGYLLPDGGPVFIPKRLAEEWREGVARLEWARDRSARYGETPDIVITQNGKLMSEDPDAARWTGREGGRR